MNTGKMESKSTSSQTVNKSNVDQSNLNDFQSENQLYMNSNYSDQFFSELRNLFVKSKFTDVVLICAEKPPLAINSDDNGNDESQFVNVSIPCHKLVLSAFSPYFQAMFSSNLLETKTNRVFLPNVDFKTLNDVVNYAYCGSIYFNVNNVQAIFQLSSLFQVKDLYNACCVYMESKLDANNCIEVHLFAKQHMCEYLITKSKEYISRHIVDVTKNREFIELEDVGLLEEILKSDDLEVTSEEQVFEALLKWAKYDPDSRVAHYERLFERSIRLNLISSAYLREFVVESDERLVSARIKRIVQENVAENEEVPNKPRAGMTKAQQCFLLIGGCPDSYDGCYVNCFNPFNGDKYFSSNSFLEKAAYEGKGFFHVEFPGVCVTSDNRLFVAGGLNVFHKLKYSIKAASLHKNRSNEDPESLLTDVRDDLRDGEEVLSNELFEYDTKNDSWIKRANMLYPKANLSLCAMRDRIYAFGGVSSGQMPLDSVEYYDMNENKWIYAGNMPTPFVAGCVVAYEDKFYVLGGRNGVGRHDCCYIFKPYTNQWIEIGKLNIGRFNFGACVIEDHLYAFGGQRYSESEEHYFTREALDSVEVYDLKSGRDEWTLGPKMPASLYNTGCFVLDEQPTSKSVYLCGTTECHYTGSTLMGFMFTSVFRLDFCNELNNRQRLKWSIVEHDVSEVKAYYRCVGARVNTRKLIKFTTDVRQIHSSTSTE